MKKAIQLMVALLAISTMPSFAQLRPASGLTFKLGDDLPAVRAALKTDAELEPMDQIPGGYNPNAGKSVLHLRSKGMTVVFSKKDVVESIKLDEAFAGSVSGVKLGDSEKMVRTTMGKPIKLPWQFGASQVFLYALDDSAYIRFDVNEANGVQAIYIQK